MPFAITKVHNVLVKRRGRSTRPVEPAFWRNELKRFVMLQRIQCAEHHQALHAVWFATNRNDLA